MDIKQGVPFDVTEKDYKRLMKDPVMGGYLAGNVKKGKHRIKVLNPQNFQNVKDYIKRVLK